MSFLAKGLSKSTCHSSDTPMLLEPGGRIFHRRQEVDHLRLATGNGTGQRPADGIVGAVSVSPSLQQQSGDINAPRQRRFGSLPAPQCLIDLLRIAQLKRY